MGQKWADMQAEYFNVNAQPYYVLVDPAADSPVAINGHTVYNPDPSVFVSWLDSGLRIFNAAK